MSNCPSDLGEEKGIVAYAKGQNNTDDTFC